MHSCSLPLDPPLAFLRDLSAEQSHLLCTLDFPRKCFKQYTLSSGVKSSFLKCDLRFSSALELSAYLERVKPSNISNIRDRVLAHVLCITVTSYVIKKKTKRKNDPT